MMRVWKTTTGIRVWRVAAIVAVIAIAAVLAVASKAAAGEWQGKTTTENGVKRVVNPAKGFQDPATIKVPEVWRLGGDTDSEDEFFGVIADIDIADNGDVYLLDSQLNEVKVFSKDGEFIRSIGHEGEGPGEFRGPVSMFFTKDDKVAVAQIMPGKIVLLTKDGTPAGEQPIPQAPDGGFQLIQRAQSRGGNTVLFLGRQKFDQEKKIWSRQSFLAGVDAAGKQLCEYASKENEINMAAAEMNDAAWDTFDRRWVVGPNGKVYTCNSYSDYEITVYNADGSVDKVITRDFKHTPRSAKEKEFMGKMMDHFAKMIPGCKVTINDMNKDIRSIFVRDDGSIWVLNSVGSENQPKGTLGTFDVFNPQGQFVKNVTVQGQGDPKEDLYLFEKDRLYVVTSFLQAAMTAQGVTGLYDDSKEAEPMAVICYKLEGDAVAVR
jgi:6-bladed beta-propeller